MHETSVVLLILKMNDMLGAAAKCIPKNKNAKITFKNECFVPSPLGALGCPFGPDCFLARMPLRSNEAPQNIKNSLF